MFLCTCTFRTKHGEFVFELPCDMPYAHENRKERERERPQSRELRNSFSGAEHPEQIVSRRTRENSAAESKVRSSLAVRENIQSRASPSPSPRSHSLSLSLPLPTYIYPSLYLSGVKSVERSGHYSRRPRGIHEIPIAIASRRDNGWGRRAARSFLSLR